MEKEPVTKFDLEAAFKALDELDIPVAEKGIAANRVNLTETFANARNNKLKTEILIEDYYDLNSEEDLEQAKTDREDEIAKAKLARIEKIVDLDAESPEDLQPSYVGKVIIQCPQCMTLFYKDPADIEPSEDDESVVNINEVCQHCGNASGYNVIGKVDAVSEDETANYDEAETEEAPVEEDELSLDFEEPTEEVDAEGTGEAETTLEEPTEETEDALNLDFTDTEEEEEKEEEEKKEESLNHSKVEREAEEGSELFTDNKSDNLTLNEDTADESLNNSEAQKEAEKTSELKTENESENLTLNEEGNAKWKALSNKPRDLLSRIKDDPNYKATDKYVFYGTDADGKVLAAVNYEHTSDKISDLKAERNKVFDKDEKIETVYVSRFFHNEKENKDEEVEVDSYMISRNKVDESLELTEASVKDLDAKLKAHNDYINYLKKMISQEEAALKSTTNEEVKAAIQRRLDAFNDDLNKALPEAVKNDLAADELPTPEETSVEEIEATEETTESVNKSENTAEIAKDELPDAKTLHEDVITVKVDTADGGTPIVTVEQEPSAPIEEPIAAPACVGPECEAPVTEPCVGPECEVVPPAVANIPAVEEPVVTDDVEAGMTADANSAVDELAAEFGIDSDVAVVEPGEAAEETAEVEETKEDDDDDDDDDDDKGGSGEAPVDEGILSAAGSVVNGVVDGVKNLLASDEAEKKDLEECSKVTEDTAEDALMHELKTPVSEDEVRAMMSDLRTEDINITNNDSPARVDNRTVDNTTEAPTTEEKPVEEGILGAVGDVVGGVVDGVENLLASDEAEKKSMDECAKTEEGLGLFGIGDVNVNLDASGQNNAVGVGGGEGKTEELEKEGLLPDGLPTPPVKVPGLTEDEEAKEDLQEGQKIDEIFGWSKKEKEEKVNKLADSLFKEYTIRLWDKKSETQDCRTFKVASDRASIESTYSNDYHKDTLAEARVLAANLSKGAKNPIADIYGGHVEANKFTNLILTYFKGNELTEKDLKTPGDSNGWSGEKSNTAFAITADGDFDKEGGKNIVVSAGNRINLEAELANRANDEEKEKAKKDDEERTKQKNELSLSETLKKCNYTGKWILKDKSNNPLEVNSEFAREKVDEMLAQAKTASAYMTVYICAEPDWKLIKVFKGTAEKEAGAKGYDAFVTAFPITESIAKNTADLSLFEDLDEETVVKHISSSLTKVYENVNKFEIKECYLENNKFIIEGNIVFKSAKVKPTKYVFTEAVINDEHKLVLTGINESLTNDGVFILTCAIDGAKLTAENLAYKYTVNNTLVEGYTNK